MQNAWRIGLEMANAIIGRSTNQLDRTLGLSGKEAEEAKDTTPHNHQHCARNSWQFPKISLTSELRSRFGKWATGRLNSQTAPDTQFLILAGRWLKRVLT